MILKEERIFVTHLKAKVQVMLDYLALASLNSASLVEDT